MGRLLMDQISFSDIAIVSCGTLSMELNHLKKEGFLDTDHLFFTTPGLHEDIREPERQLRQLDKNNHPIIDVSEHAHTGLISTKYFPSCG
jgi:hypothetical protein